MDPIDPSSAAKPESDERAAALPLFLSVDEAAELLRLNRKTLYEAVKLDQVPGVVRVGRSIRIHRSALLSWGVDRCRPALSE